MTSDLRFCLACFIFKKNLMDMKELSESISSTYKDYAANKPDKLKTGWENLEFEKPAWLHKFLLFFDNLAKLVLR
ncbi:MAG: hypothetical protein K0S11_614 [Gammaproteobacteria bacterium]|nr:hypothetical protein [Gammaproteobacteria bacterium]